MSRIGSACWVITGVGVGSASEGAYKLENHDEEAVDVRNEATEYQKCGAGSSPKTVLGHGAVTLMPTGLGSAGDLIVFFQTPNPSSL